ncbi:MAG: AAA family ATPase [Clostridiales bacterium]|nr:AAA family ATPase [Clostridiales bacterium]
MNSVRLGYSEEALSLQGLGYRNIILLFVLLNSLLEKQRDYALNAVMIEEPEAHLCINNIRLLISFLNVFTQKNSLVQLFYSTHSTEFINKMDLRNVVIMHNGQAYSFVDELTPTQLDYLTKNPNLDLFKLFFSKKCILVEGISEEMLIRAYLTEQKALNDIELLSFHKGFIDIIKIWKKVNSGSGNKLGIIRDYDDQDKAKENHDKFNDDKNICVRTTHEYTLEPEIVKTGNNYSILRDKYGETFGWTNFTEDEMQQAWRNAKASEMLRICQDLANGELKGFQLPQHIKEVLDFLS